MSKAYPRGAKLLKKVLRVFNTTDTQRWFNQRGVQLKTEEDGRVFPVSNSSQSIIDCLLREMNSLGVAIISSKSVTAIEDGGKKVELKFKTSSAQFDKVIVATGGTPKLSGFDWLQDLDIDIISPVPSLFTFNIPGNPITQLMGVVAENAIVRVPGLKHVSSGPLLITHWGMSGPAVLKLSAFAARELAERGYDHTLQVNWIGENNHDEVYDFLHHLFSQNPKKQLGSVRPYKIPSRLWEYFIDKANLVKTKPCQEIGKKSIHKITSLLTQDIYSIKGKTTFKEEFVTCGGISLSSIHHDTLQAKSHPNVYFAGEVLDIDGITGGYNFQAAWSTGFIAGKLKSKE